MRRRLQARRLGLVAAAAAWAASAAPAQEFVLPSRVEHFALEHPAAEPIRPVVVALALCDATGRLATGGDDGLIRLWNAAAGEIERTIVAHADWVRGVDFHPGGGLLASGGDDGRLRLWNAADGRRLREWDVASSVYDVRFSRDGSRLAAAGFAGLCLVVDPHSGAVLQRLKCPCQDVRCLAFSPDGKLLAAAGRNGRIRLWDVASGSRLGDVATNARRLRRLEFVGPRQLLAAGDGGTVQEWDVDSGAKLREWPTGQGRVYALALIGNDAVATGGSNNSVRFWRRSDGRLLGELTDAQGTVAGLVYRPATGELIGCGYDATVRLWRLKPSPSDG